MLSYEIERWFYHHLSSRLPASVKAANAYPTDDDDGDLLLEDLSDEYPYPARGSLGRESTLAVLKWLGGFHATFFKLHQWENIKLVPPPNLWKHEKVEGVWSRGVYWYLETRREELAQTDEEEYEWLMPWVEKVREVRADPLTIALITLSRLIMQLTKKSRRTELFYTAM